MLIKENELRKSPETQALYKKAEMTDETDWMEVTDMLQRQILRDYGLDEVDLEKGLFSLRTATKRFPELSDIPLYVKYNRARQGDLTVGDPAPNVPLVTLDEEKCDLHDYCSSSRPLLLMAGSYT